MSNKVIDINLYYKGIRLQLEAINADLDIEIGNLQNKYNKIYNSTDENKSKNYHKYLDEIETFQDNINDELNEFDEIVPQIIELMEKTRDHLDELYNTSQNLAEHLADYKVGSLQSLALKAVPKMTRRQRRAIPEHIKELIKNVKTELKHKSESRRRPRSSNKGGRHTRKRSFR